MSLNPSSLSSRAKRSALLTTLASVAFAGSAAAQTAPAAAPAAAPNPTDSVGLQYLKRDHGGFLGADLGWRGIVGERTHGVILRGQERWRQCRANRVQRACERPRPLCIDRMKRA